MICKINVKLNYCLFKIKRWILVEIYLFKIYLFKINYKFKLLVN